MIYEPLKHQQIAAEFLKEHKRCALFLDMGLGKTVITLTHIKELYDNFAVDKVLVIAPKRVAEDTWTREVSKWDHLQDLRVSSVLGSEKQRLKALTTPADVYVINRDNVQWLVELYAERWPFDMVVIDELSSFKSSTSKRFRMLKRVMKLTNYFIGLTGTPASNGYMDLYAEIYLIDGGESLGKTITNYRNTYFNIGAHKGHIVYEYKLKHGAKEAIDKKLSKFCLSMSKEDWINLPPIIYNNIYVHMSASEKKIYEQFKKDKVLPILQEKIGDLENYDSAIVADTAAVLSGKLLQMANGAVYDENGSAFHISDAKLDALEELVDYSSGQPILVFYSYKHDLQRIQERFPEAVKLETPDHITKWNNKEIPILLCHPASAAYGINIQEGGHIIVWFGLPWSLELYTQANARLYRQGQTQSVIVHHLVSNNTIDEKVLVALQNKDATQKSLLNALKSYVQESFTDGDI